WEDAERGGRLARRLPDVAAEEGGTADSTQEEAEDGGQQDAPGDCTLREPAHRHRSLVVPVGRNPPAGGHFSLDGGFPTALQTPGETGSQALHVSATDRVRRCRPRPGRGARPLHP